MTEESKIGPQVSSDKAAARNQLEAIYDKLKSPKTAKADFVNDWLEYCTAGNQPQKATQ